MWLLCRCEILHSCFVHKSWLQLISFKKWQSLQGWSMFCSPGFLLHPVCVFMYKGVFFMRTLKRCLHTCKPCFGAREGHYTMHCIIVIIIVIYSDKTKLFNFSYLYTLQQRYYIKLCAPMTRRNCGIMLHIYLYWDMTKYYKIEGKINDIIWPLVSFCPFSVCNYKTVK